MEILLQSHALRGEHMVVSIGQADMLWPVLWDHNSQARVSITVDLPCQVLLDFSGKDPNRDTVIDDDGAILEDKHVMIRNIWLDRFAIDALFLKKLAQITTSNQQVNSNYVGHNGRIRLDMDQRNGFLQIQKWRCLGRGLVDQ